MNTPWITLAIQSHNFQHRLSWMLASLAEQEGPGANVLVDLAYVCQEGTPTTEQIIRLYKTPNISWILRPYAKAEDMQYRGIVRSQQLADCKTPWLLFTDTDMVYHCLYFSRLKEWLENENLYESGGFFSAGRLSNPVEETNNLVKSVGEETDGYTKPIDHAFQRAHTLTPIEKSNVGAGYSQLINVNHCPHGGYYVKDKVDRAWYKPDGNTKGQKARSEERRVGKECRSRWSPYH